MQAIAPQQIIQVVTLQQTPEGPQLVSLGMFDALNPVNVIKNKVESVRNTAEACGKTVTGKGNLGDGFNCAKGAYSLNHPFQQLNQVQ